jgi:hypothetical protein
MAKFNTRSLETVVCATLAALWIGRAAYMRDGRLMEGFIAAFSFLAAAGLFSYISQRAKR